MASENRFDEQQDNSSDEKSFLDAVCISYLNEQGDEIISQQQVANYLCNDLTNAQQVLEDILKECLDNESESDEDDESLSVHSRTTSQYGSNSDDGSSENDDSENDDNQNDDSENDVYENHESENDDYQNDDDDNETEKPLKKAEDLKLSISAIKSNISTLRNIKNYFFTSTGKCDKSYFLEILKTLYQIPDNGNNVIKSENLLLDKFPVEVLFMIFKYLSTKDLLNLSCLTAKLAVCVAKPMNFESLDGINRFRNPILNLYEPAYWPRWFGYMKGVKEIKFGTSILKPWVAVMLINKLPKLERITIIEDCPLKELGNIDLMFSIIARKSTLQSIKIETRNTSLTESSFKSIIQGLNQLKELDINFVTKEPYNSPIFSNSLLHDLSSKHRDHLQILVFNNININSEGFQYISECTNLRLLALKYIDGPMNGQTFTYLKRLTKLRELRLFSNDSSENTGDIDFDFPDLEKLNIGQDLVSIGIAKKIFAGSPNLRHLTFTKFENLNNEDLIELSRNNKSKLETLSLHCRSEITIDILDKIFAEIKLKKIRITSNSPNFNHRLSGIKSILEQKYPNTIIDIPN